MPESYNILANQLKRSEFKDNLHRNAYIQQRKKMIANLKKQAESKGLECESVFASVNDYFKRVTGEDFELVYYRKLNCGLNIVYLHLMHKMAIDENVPMIDLDVMLKKDPIRFNIPTDDDNRLNKYFNFLKSGQSAQDYNPEEIKKIQAGWVHVSSSTSRDFIIPGSANSTDNSKIIPGTQKKGRRWELSWQEDEYKNKSSEGITNIGYRQDWFDGEAGDEYSLRGICPNKPDKAILPDEKRIPDGVCTRDEKPKSRRSMSARKN